MAAVLTPADKALAAGFAGDELGPVWTHDTQPVWVSRYPAVEGVRPAHFIPYRAVKPVPAGAKPWTVDNRRIGTDRGFPTLVAAIEATGAAA